MQATVTRIVNEFSNVSRWPVGWCDLNCGHTSKLELVDQIKSAHVKENQVTKVGDVVQCDYCDRQAKNIETLRTMDVACFSHSRFRHNDSRGFGPGRIYVYEADKTSPTRCKLLLSLDDTAQSRAALGRFFGGSPLSPTEKR